MKSHRGITCLVGLLLLATSPALPQGSASPKDPRLGGSQGKLRYRISRAPYELVETPAVVTLQGGKQVEAYWLEVYGKWVVFYVKETGDSWLREEVAGSEVTQIEFDTYLDRDPVEPREIKRARKQPVRKQEILSGTFTGKQGRYTEWKITFKSEISKMRAFAEDATEYGAVHIESRFDQTSGGQAQVHDVRARGKYYLYAPGTVNNKDWVLIFSDVIQREVDRSPNITMFSDRLHDETLILNFSPKQDAFTLEWSNLGARTWTSIVGLRFEREAEAARSERRRIAPGPDAKPSTKPGNTTPSSRSRTDWRDPRANRVRVATSTRDRAAAVRKASTTQSGHRWQTGNWGKPSTYWNGRRK